MMNLLDLQLNEIEEQIVKLGEPKFRAKQIFSWLNRGASLDEMNNIPNKLKEKIKENFDMFFPKISLVQESKIDGTRKYLFELSDGNKIESVFMRYKFGNSICVSSQAGCRMGCKFCASTIGGLKRNLTPGEILGQVLMVEKDTDERISHIVIMGTGEPFDNYDNVSKFLHIVNDKEGLNIGMRNITVSTSGIVPMIEKFSNDFRETNLAISLHAPNDKLRSSIMPINNKYSIEEVISASKKYINSTKRRITFEYTLVKDFNDKDSDAQELSRLLHGMLCHVNLIPLNVVNETGLKTSTKERALAFQKILVDNKINATIRRELGDDIDAACGQLRLNR